MKKRKTTASNSPEFVAPLMRLAEVQDRWNMRIGELNSTRHAMPEAMPEMLEGFGADCGDMLAQVEMNMEGLMAMPEMRKVLASLVESKKMEIRRGAISVTDFIEKSTNRRLHTHLFFVAHGTVAFGEGLDDYKDIMEELVRRLKLLTKMGSLTEIMLGRCISELKECSEMFRKKRESILEKAGISLEYLPLFSKLIDDALMMPKARVKYHQISLATFHAERSIKYITLNMAEMFDDLHSPNTEPMLQQFKRTKTALRKELPTMPMHRGMMEHRASA